MIDGVTAPSWPFLMGGGEMGALMRAHDWSATAFGSPDSWPPALRCMVGACLNSPLLGTVLWGPDLLMLYNDAYSLSLGERHPAALGRPVRHVWGSAWDKVSQPFLATLATGEGFERRGICLEIMRHGQRESTLWDFSAAPIRDEAGRIVGLLNQGVETTAQVRALEASRTAEDRYAMALSAGGGIGAWDWDVPNDRVIADERFANLYGVDPAEAARGAPISAFFRDVHPDDRPRLNAAIERSLATGAEFAEEYRLTGRASGDRWIVARGKPYLDARGQPVRFPGVTFDVTDLQLSRAALQSSEARNRQVLDSAVDFAIVATDLEGRVTRWNQGAERTLGWTEQEMLGQSAERFFTPEDVAAGRIRVEMAEAHSQGSGNDERWHLRKNGQRFFAQGKLTPLLDEAGLLTGYVKVLRDRTEERIREQRLRLLARASEGLLQVEQPDDVLNPVLEASAELIDFDQSYSYVLTPDGQHLRLNHSFGVRPDVAQTLQHAPLDGPLCGIVASTMKPLILEQLQASTEPRYAPGRDAGLNAFAGYPISVQDKLFGVLSFGSYSRAAFDPEALSFFATLAYYVSVVRDRLDREATLQELNATLEARIAERSRELMVTEEQLRQSQKMEAVGQLTGGLAHDFNNLLTGVTGSLELLQTRIAQGRIKDVDRYVNAAQGGARRAAALTHRLLAFSRRQTLDPKPTDVNRLVCDMEELIRRTMGPAITVEPMVGAAGIWPTLVDPGQLENALLNLCINARDAMPDGGKLTIETANRGLDERAARARDLPPGQYLSLCVSDTGTGMSPDVIAKAFEPFFTTKPTGMGTGLGLSMIYGFVKQSGGQVRIHSEIGQGTTICLYLPRHLGAADNVEPAPELADAPRAEHGQTVLVVDDEPTIRMLVTEVLEDLGYRAIEAADGPAGLQVLQSDARIDLLVTDVGLPGGMNGRQR